MADALPSEPLAITSVRLTVASLFAAAGQPVPLDGADLFTITPLVMKQFGHLPQPLNVTCEGEEVIIRYRVTGAGKANFYTLPPGVN